MNIIEPTIRYQVLLTLCGVLDPTEDCIVDPFDNDLNKVSDIVLLQQGNVNWDINSEESVSRIKFAITPNMFIYRLLTSYNIRTALLEFPIPDIFTKKTPWMDRENAIYYHGRIIPGKVDIDELMVLSDMGIKIVMRGPVCKAYWTDFDIEEEEFVKFRDKFMRIVDDGDVELLEATNDSDVIIEDLNKYKFYFSLSNGEAFNIALEEAIACGAVPIVRSNDAYWWADKLIVNFTNVERLANDFHMYSKDNLEEYSTLIATEIKKRDSFEVTLEKFKRQDI